ncbi:MAG: LysR family transcriptional regulator [Beduini sp.]|uniref:LysR family transcriptional regulator n=1 Tax=Beduini sp. TaxID=1922300 RepID=UPI0039A1C4EF
MKLEVFEYLIAIEKHGSLTKAAQSLYVSQPNLSNVIKGFENELGYAVIYRNHQGVCFTEKGKQVLMIAHNMIKEKEKLLNINLDHKRISLKISIGNGDYALSPIYEMMNCQSTQDEINITIVNCPVWETLEKIYDQTIDLAYLIISKTMEKQIQDFCYSHHLLFNPLKEMMCQINLRKDHPLLTDFSKEGLWNYPFVDFINQKDNTYGIYQQYINPKKVIKIDHHSLRPKIVSKTDAFSIGIATIEKKNEYNLASIPTPELMMIICEIRKEKDKDNPLFNQYRQIIKENISTI